MRITLSSEQYKFFWTQGYIEFAPLFSEEELTGISRKMKALAEQTPGRLMENLFRSIPELVALMRQRQLGQLLHALVKKSPLSLRTDRFFTELPPALPLLEEGEWGGIIYFGKGAHTGGVFLFQYSTCIEQLYQDKDTHYWLFIVSSKKLQHSYYPCLYR